MFMLEQIVPYNYINRWYKHDGSTFLKDENVSYEKVREYVHELELLIKKCGLQLHSLGHGYMLEPYGIHYKTINDKYELNAEAIEDIAIVNGKKELFLGSPNFTQLCYSNPNIRAKLVKFLADYAQNKPYIDFLHVWLSDAANNQCECENCINERVSDLYVKLLNELDLELTRRGIDMKIVFILYVDTLWAPLYEKINNTDRFVMLTAIGGRDYSKPYDSTPYDKPIPKYVKNKYSVEESFPLRLEFMKEWKRAFNGRKFVYEYHMYMQHYNDPGYIRLSELLLQDIKNIGNFDIQGIMSDQTQRSFFPNGLPMCIYARGSFDTDLDFDKFTKDYFKSAYGDDWNLALNYLKSISSLMSPDVLQTKMNIVDMDVDIHSKKKQMTKIWMESREVQSDFKNAIKLAENFKGIANKNTQLSNKTWQKSWQLLKIHTEYVMRYADILLSFSSGNKDEAKTKFDEFVDVFSKYEVDISTEFDLFLFVLSLKRKLNLS